MITHIKGDAIALAKKDGNFLLHGCNCFSTWGAGIAKALKEEWPDAYEADRKSLMKPIAKIGSYTEYRARVAPNRTLTIVNLYTQFDYGRDRSFEYGAFKLALREFLRDFSLLGARIYMPKIGAGLGGGDWNLIQTIMEEEIEHGNWFVCSLES